jgi:hypothetical protein
MLLLIVYTLFDDAKIQPLKQAKIKENGRKIAKIRTKLRWSETQKELTRCFS